MQLSPARSTVSNLQDQFSVSTFQGEFKFHSLKAIQRNFIVYIFMIFMIIYIYSYVYLCIYTPSYQHFKAFAVSKFDSETTFQRQFKVHSLKAIQHVSSGIHVYIYIQYQINILKPLQCPQLQRAQGYVQLAPARKLA